MRLNDNSIRKLETPASGYRLIRDGEMPGLGLRLTANGTRSFTFTYTVNGRQRRLTVGPWPAWTATAARERAKELRRMVDRGEDPRRRQGRTAPTPAHISLDVKTYTPLTSTKLYCCW